MPSDPDNKIEELLKAYAKKRREDAGTPLELHPATRNLLQAEVARLRPAPAAKRASWLNALVGLWPRVAFAVSILVVAAVAVWLLNPPMNPARQLAKTERATPAPLAAEEGEQLAKNMPVSRPQSRITALDDLESAREESVRVERKLLLGRDGDERSKVHLRAWAVSTDGTASKPDNQSQPAQAPLATPAATTPTGPSPAARTYNGGFVVGYDASQTERDLKRKAENRPAAIQDEAKAVQLSFNGSTSTVFGDSFDSVTVIAPNSYGLSAPPGSLHLLTPNTPFTSLVITNQPPALSIAGTDKYFYRADNSASVESSITERRLQPAPMLPPVAKENQLALSKSTESLARREVAATGPAVEPGAGKNVDRLSAVRDPASRPQAGNEETRLATRFKSAAVSEKPADSAAMSDGRWGRFNRVDDVSGKLGVAGAARAPTVLATFEIEQAGDRIRVTDADGSVYEGQLVADASDLNRSAGQAGLKLEPEKADGLKEQPFQQKLRAPAAPPAAQSISFRVSGTNRGLNQLVIIDGALLPAPEAAQPAARGLDAKTATSGPPLNAARLQVRIGPANPVEINARRVTP